jgi:SAM-dependent methyltransferase
VTGAATGFGAVGGSYGSQLARGLRLTGEPAEYYARRRMTRVRDLARTLGVKPRAVVDFGCGIGTSLSLLRDTFPDADIVGFEPEPGLAHAACSAAAAAGAELVNRAEDVDARFADIVYCNGVLHHVERAERGRTAEQLVNALRPGGLAFVWENSPFNPGTRMVMARIPFDRGAMLLRPSELRVLQRDAGLTPLRTEFHFVFPRPLRFARPLENALRALPLGGQYLVVGRLDTGHG